MMVRIDPRKALLLVAAICTYIAEEMIEQPQPRKPIKTRSHRVV